jgi:hypothetical protein
MRKLKLQFDSLKVETFATGDRRELRGTVAGRSGTITQSGTCGTGCGGYTDGGDTCHGGIWTCHDSCDTLCNSYYGTCYTADCC